MNFEQKENMDSYAAALTEVPAAPNNGPAILRKKATEILREIARQIEAQLEADPWQSIYVKIYIRKYVTQQIFQDQLFALLDPDLQALGYKLMQSTGVAEGHHCDNDYGSPSCSCSRVPIWIVKSLADLM